MYILYIYYIIRVKGQLHFGKYFGNVSLIQRSYADLIICHLVITYTCWSWLSYKTHYSTIIAYIFCSTDGQSQHWQCQYHVSLMLCLISYKRYITCSVNKQEIALLCMWVLPPVNSQNHTLSCTLAMQLDCQYLSFLLFFCITRWRLPDIP